MQQIQSIHATSAISEKPFNHSHSIGIVKPIVSAMAVAILSMGAAQAFATPVPAACLGDTVTDTSTVTVSNTCTIVSGGAIEVSVGQAISVFSSSEVNTNISNAGLISGVSGIVALDENHTTTINNSGTLAGISFAVNRVYGSQTTNIINSPTGQIVGRISATNLTNNGTVTLKRADDLDDIENSGNATIANLSGEFISGADSTLRIAIEHAGDATPSSIGTVNYSYLQAATATVDGTLDVDVKETSGLKAGESFHVVRAPDMTTTFDQVTDNSAMFNFTQRLESAGIYIDSVTALTAYKASGLDAGSVLDSGAPGLSGVVSALGLLATEQEVADAVKSTQPGLTGGVAQVTNVSTNAITAVIASRQASTRGLSSGDEMMSDRHFWFKPIGGWTEQDDSQGVTGYDINSHGLALGLDGDVSASWNVGFALAYLNSDVKSNLAAGTHTIGIDSYQAKVYATKTFDDVTALNLQAGLGMSNYDSSRRLFTNDVASADYDSKNVQLSAELDRSYQVSAKIVMTPYVHADYGHVNVESYSETGAGALNLNVGNDSSDSLIIGTGVKANYTLSDNLLLMADAGVGYDVMTERSNLTSSFAGGGANFTTEGIKPAEFVYNAGFGAKYSLVNGTEITASYNIVGREGYTDQSASANFRMMF